MKRIETRKVFVKNIQIGGQNKVVIQSMTNTHTKDIDATVKQILELEDLGCEIIRVAVLDMEDAKAIKEIIKKIHIPLVADIHFDYRLALEAINSGANKIRINPGNMSPDKLKIVVEAAKSHNIPIRVGVNSGSLPEISKKYKDKAEGLFEGAKFAVKLLEDLDFYDIVVSLKASDVLTTIKAYELAANYFPYPLHIGITEAGDEFTSAIRSSAGLGILLKESIGDTIRISINGDHKSEIIACKELLKAMNLYKGFPTLVACPTCGRCQLDMANVVQEVKKYLYTLNKDIKVAIMGCVVNGPGEAKDADIGIAGGSKDAVLIKHGEIIRKIDGNNLAKELIDEIKKM